MLPLTSFRGHCFYFSPASAFHSQVVKVKKPQMHLIVRGPRRLEFFIIRLLASRTFFMSGTWRERLEETSFASGRSMGFPLKKDELHPRVL